jgi:hypothetical protein
MENIRINDKIDEQNNQIKQQLNTSTNSHSIHSNSKPNKFYFKKHFFKSDENFGFLFENRVKQNSKQEIISENNKNLFSFCDNLEPESVLSSNPLIESIERLYEQNDESVPHMRTQTNGTQFASNSKYFNDCNNNQNFQNKSIMSQTNSGSKLDLSSNGRSFPSIRSQNSSVANYERLVKGNNSRIPPISSVSKESIRNLQLMSRQMPTRAQSSSIPDSLKSWKRPLSEPMDQINGLNSQKKLKSVSFDQNLTSFEPKKYTNPHKSINSSKRTNYCETALQSTKQMNSIMNLNPNNDKLGILRTNNSLKRNFSKRSTQFSTPFNCTIVSKTAKSAQLKNILSQQSISSSNTNSISNQTKNSNNLLNLFSSGVPKV